MSFWKYNQDSTSFSSPLRLTMGEAKNDVMLARVKDHAAPRCVCGIMDGYSSRQCDTPGKEQDSAGDWWCGRHSPTAVARTKAKQDSAEALHRAKWKRRQDEDARRRDAIANEARFRAALEAIAQGHNDARGLAREVLGITD